MLTSQEVLVRSPDSIIYTCSSSDLILNRDSAMFFSRVQKRTITAQTNQTGNSWISDIPNYRGGRNNIR